MPSPRPPTAACRLASPFFAFFLATALAPSLAPTDAAVITGLAVEAGSVTLDDVGTGITDLKTLHNGRDFSVTVELSWSEIAVEKASSDVLAWETLVDGVKIDGGTYDWGGSPILPESLSAGTGRVTSSGEHVVEVKITLDGEETTGEGTWMSFDAGAAFVPLIVVLVLSVTTNIVELSLGSGIFVGACMVTGTVINGFKTTLDTYILDALADKWHGYVYLFTVFIAGLIGMIERSGGLKGITEVFKIRIRSPRSAQTATFLSGLVIFFDDYANSLVAGEAMRPLSDAFYVSREKLSFIVDATAAPIASIVPISSWIGFEVGLIDEEMAKILERFPDAGDNINTSAYGVFLETIKYRYYAIFMLFLMPLLIALKRDMGPMLIAERRVRVYGRTDGGDGGTKGAGGVEAKDPNKPGPDVPCRWWNMAVPIAFLYFYVFYLLVKTGDDGSGEQSFMDKIQSSDSYAALLWGTMASALTSYGFYLFQDKKDGNIVWFNIMGRLRSWIPRRCQRREKPSDEEGEEDGEKKEAVPLMTIKESMSSFVAGMEHIFGALLVLTLAWAAGSIMVTVGLDRLFAEIILQSNLNYKMLPTISFLVSLLIALATGTSWGTMTIMFPLLLVPTYEASGGNATVFYATIAGILAGAVAGDHASPISDTTVLSSLACDCELLEHVRTQAPYVLVVCIWSILVGTIPIGLESYPNGVAIFLGFVFMAAHAWFTSASVINESGRFDVFTEAYIWITKHPGLLELKKDTALAFSHGGFVEVADVKVKEINTGKTDASFMNEDPNPPEQAPGDVEMFNEEETA